MWRSFKLMYLMFWITRCTRWWDLERSSLPEISSCSTRAAAVPPHECYQFRPLEGLQPSTHTRTAHAADPYLRAAGKNSKRPNCATELSLNPAPNT